MAAPEVLSDDGLGDSMDEDSDRANFFSSDEEGEIEMRMSGELGSESTAPLPSNDGDTADVLQSSPFHKGGRSAKLDSPALRKIGESKWAFLGSLDSGLGEEYESIPLVQQALSISGNLVALHAIVANELFVCGGAANSSGAAASARQPRAVPNFHGSGTQSGDADAPHLQPSVSSLPRVAPVAARHQTPFTKPRPAWLQRAMSTFERQSSGIVAQLELSAVAKRARRVPSGAAPGLHSAQRVQQFGFQSWYASKQDYEVALGGLHHKKANSFRVWRGTRYTCSHAVHPIKLLVHDTPPFPCDTRHS